MSVRFHFAGDKDISVGRAGGASVFKPSAVAPSCPANGTFYQVSTGVPYPASEGGTEVFVYETSANYPNQTASVDTYHDGSCGTYYDWASASNIAVQGYGVTIVVVTDDASVTVEINSNYYQVGTADYTAYHDGAGGYYLGYENYSYSPYGTYLTNATGQSVQIEVPSSSMNYVVAGTCDYNYYSDGAGGYYNTQVNISWYPYGTFLYNDGSYDYYSDGNGGYYY